MLCFTSCFMILFVLWLSIYSLVCITFFWLISPPPFISFKLSTSLQLLLHLSFLPLPASFFNSSSSLYLLNFTAPFPSVLLYLLSFQQLLLLISLTHHVVVEPPKSHISILTPSSKLLKIIIIIIIIILNSGFCSKYNCTWRSSSWRGSSCDR